jgi:hypothetical protein
MLTAAPPIHRLETQRPNRSSLVSVNASADACQGPGGPIWGWEKWTRDAIPGFDQWALETAGLASPGVPLESLE